MCPNMRAYARVCAFVCVSACLCVSDLSLRVRYDFAFEGHINRPPHLLWKCLKHVWTSGPDTCNCLPTDDVHLSSVCAWWMRKGSAHVCVCVRECVCLYQWRACQEFEHHHRGLFPSICDLRTEISGSSHTHPVDQAEAPALEPSKAGMVVTIYFTCKQHRAHSMYSRLIWTFDASIACPETKKGKIK